MTTPMYGQGEGKWHNGIKHNTDSYPSPPDSSVLHSNSLSLSYGTQPSPYQEYIPLNGISSPVSSDSASFSFFSENWPFSTPQTSSGQQQSNSPHQLTRRPSRNLFDTEVFQAKDLSAHSLSKSKMQEPGVDFPNFSVQDRAKLKKVRSDFALDEFLRFLLFREKTFNQLTAKEVTDQARQWAANHPLPLPDGFVWKGDLLRALLDSFESRKKKGLADTVRRDFLEFIEREKADAQRRQQGQYYLQAFKASSPAAREQCKSLPSLTRPSSGRKVSGTGVFQPAYMNDDEYAARFSSTSVTDKLKQGSTGGSSNEEEEMPSIEDEKSSLAGSLFNTHLSFHGFTFLEAMKLNEIIDQARQWAANYPLPLPRGFISRGDMMSSLLDYFQDDKPVLADYLRPYFEKFINRNQARLPSIPL